MVKSAVSKSVAAKSKGKTNFKELTCQGMVVGVGERGYSTVNLQNYRRY